MFRQFWFAAVTTMLALIGPGEPVAAAGGVCSTRGVAVPIDHDAGS
jgi:hypothetical protein